LVEPMGVEPTTS